jgi:hypothetical protein
MFLGALYGFVDLSQRRAAVPDLFGQVVQVQSLPTPKQLQQQQQQQHSSNNSNRPCRASGCAIAER